MIQYWFKKGNIFDIKHFLSNYNFSSVPCGFWLNSDVMRIYFSSRNKDNISIPFRIDYNFSELKIEEGPETIGLENGDLGLFDDSGVMPSSLIIVNGVIYLYYIGWNLGVTVPFRNSIGLAKSTDNGKTFIKSFKGPIVDRTKEEPHFCASCCVLHEGEIFKMWYLSCVDWKKDEGNIQHRYHIKYATSSDGQNWNREGLIAIDFENENEYAISVPRVIKEHEIYKMWYSYRGSIFSSNYRIGYAESNDGINWERKDKLIDFEVSNYGWDSEMLCYPFIFDYKNERFMLYNGNEFGKTGFGLSKLIREDKL